MYAHHHILYRTTLPHTHQENGLAERINRTLFDNARAALTSSKLLAKYWEHAVKDYTEKYNHTPPTAHNQLPEYIWTQFPVNITTLQLFGQFGHVYNPAKKTKLQPRAFIGRYLLQAEPTTTSSLT